MYDKQVGSPTLPGRAANHSPLEGESQKPSRQAKADAVGGDKVAACGIALKLSGRQAANAAGCLKLSIARRHGRGRTPWQGQDAGGCLAGDFSESRPENEDEPRMDTNKHQ